MNDTTQQTSEGTDKEVRNYWLRRWQENAIGWHHEEYNPHLLGFWGLLAVPAGSRVLVPLCGKSRDLVWLSEHGYRILGVELSPLAVSAFFAEQGLEPDVEEGERFERWQAEDFEILCGDVFQLQPGELKGVAAVYERASLVALDPQQRRRYADLLTRLLPSGCRVLLVTMDYPQHEMAGPPYSVTGAEVKELFEEQFEITLLDTIDLLRDSDRYQGYGLSRLSEQIYLLQRR